MSNFKTIGKKIAEKRKSLGLTQEDLAGFADMDRSYLSEIENGRVNFTLGLLFVLSKILKSDPKSFF